ncbi:MAG: Rare lipoprotein A [Candidatus Tokpelaia hoelldobleri]|uniref:Endolytic peptidoglycan transglycosylase RlpA n=1 Tax=Candidatus Tokpelaia hoelldobleri TaxID=1902579 RepID=A0A1U9JUT6_9HYPH|nr:MAG: Rare lipoprotein A [Candidatus Tokpelaia hoelldoblerii]
MNFASRNRTNNSLKSLEKMTLLLLYFSLTACSSLLHKDNRDQFVTGSIRETDHDRKPEETFVRVAGIVKPSDAPHEKVGKPYQVNGVWYYPERDPHYVRTGKASWYGAGFHGKQTANGEIFDLNAITAAHTTMPLPSYARVTNLHNGVALVVRVNDRGPFSSDRIIDLSQRAALLLGFTKRGLADVRVEYIGPAPVDKDMRPPAYKTRLSLDSTGINTYSQQLSLPQNRPGDKRRPALSLRGG